MDFKSYVNSLPNVKSETIKAIALATCSTTITVYRWLSGDVKVPPLKRKIIANVLDKSEAELWPEDDKK